MIYLEMFPFKTTKGRRTKWDRLACLPLLPGLLVAMLFLTKLKSDRVAHRRVAVGLGDHPGLVALLATLDSLHLGAVGGLDLQLSVAHLDGDISPCAPGLVGDSGVGGGWGGGGGEEAAGQVVPEAAEDAGLLPGEGGYRAAHIE